MLNLHGAGQQRLGSGAKELANATEAGAAAGSAGKGPQTGGAASGVIPLWRLKGECSLSQMQSRCLFSDLHIH